MTYLQMVFVSALAVMIFGEELRAQTLPANTHVVVIGSETLTQRYQQALAQRHVTAQRVDAQATWAGLWALAQTIHSGA